ncbi:hypothetical protein CEXT_163001 [Caerostris extrusa]|uniref:Uncharacterized protein n=1 Tax=Caerostris extrusa TaxID=172846 RepID=A0AAV4WWA5_CAEEX|nr:hypothetical protein CEXT_163001 [Caerostris extrusa]
MQHEQVTQYPHCSYPHHPAPSCSTHTTKTAVCSYHYTTIVIILSGTYLTREFEKRGEQSKLDLINIPDWCRRISLQHALFGEPSTISPIYDCELQNKLPGLYTEGRLILSPLSERSIVCTGLG